MTVEGVGCVLGRAGGLLALAGEVAVGLTVEELRRAGVQRPRAGAIIRERRERGGAGRVGRGPAWAGGEGGWALAGGPKR